MFMNTLMNSCFILTNLTIMKINIKFDIMYEFLFFKLLNYNLNKCIEWGLF